MKKLFPVYSLAARCRRAVRGFYAIIFVTERAGGGKR